jgi:hypothetical protein
MNKEEFNNLYKPNMKQGLTYKDPRTGYREKAILTSGINSNVNGDYFVRVTHHHKQVVDLRDIETIKDLNIPW